jgi:predicted secreted hydrolase
MRYCLFKRKIIIMIVIGLLLFSTLGPTNQITNVHASEVEMNHSISVNSSTLSTSSTEYEESRNVGSNNVQDIELKDDAFHGSHHYFSMEWWYFDAILNDDYELHAGFKVFSLRNFGVVYPIIEIYKGRDLIVKILKPSLLQNFSTSMSYPCVKVDGQSIIKFDMEEFNTTGRWKYTVSVNKNNQGINLTFIGTTKGWRYTIMGREEWAVILPKADVFGTITVDGKSINVTGRGYHDHNWNYTIGTKVREWGWYWGRLTGETYSVIFAWFMKSPVKFDNLVVLNKDSSGYVEINPKDITLSFIKYIFRNGTIIPSNFRLSIDNTSLKVYVLMNTISTHLIGSPLVHYWRYFVNVNGFISNDDDIEYFIDSVQMFEVMRFK